MADRTERWSWNDVDDVEDCLLTDPVYGDSTKIRQRAVDTTLASARNAFADLGPPQGRSGVLDLWHPAVIGTVERALDVGRAPDGLLELGWTPRGPTPWRLVAGPDLGGDLADPVVVHRDSPDEADRVLWRLAVLQWGLPTDHLRRATDQEVEALHAARGLVVEHVGRLGADALGFAHHYGVQVADHISASTDMSIPGFALLSEELFAEPEHLAASVFHEALHSKKSIIELGSGRERSDREDDCVFIAWHRDSDPWWSPGRSLDALHVYLYLAVYAARRWASPHLADDARVELRRCIFRATYLAELVSRVLDRLSALDAGMHAWLTELLPPPLDLNATGQHWLDFARSDESAIRRPMSDLAEP